MIEIASAAVMAAEDSSSEFLPPPEHRAESRIPGENSLKFFVCFARPHAFTGVPQGERLAVVGECHRQKLKIGGKHGYEAVNRGIEADRGKCWRRSNRSCPSRAAMENTTSQGWLFSPSTEAAMPAESSASVKIFVLDTNVILHDSGCIHNYAEHDIAIPITVLEELDKFKRGNEDINFQAREFLRRLDDLTGDALSETG